MRLDSPKMFDCQCQKIFNGHMLKCNKISKSTKRELCQTHINLIEMVSPWSKHKLWLNDAMSLAGKAPVGMADTCQDEQH